MSDLSLHLSVQVKPAAWNKEKPGSWYSQYRKGKQVLFSSNPFLLFLLLDCQHLCTAQFGSSVFLYLNCLA